MPHVKFLCAPSPGLGGESRALIYSARANGRSASRSHTGISSARSAKSPRSKAPRNATRFIPSHCCERRSKSACASSTERTSIVSKRVDVVIPVTSLRAACLARPRLPRGTDTHLRNGHAVVGLAMKANAFSCKSIDAARRQLTPPKSCVSIISNVTLKLDTGGPNEPVTR